MQNTGKSESANPKIKEVRILSKTEHDNIVEFKVSGDLALFADVLTRPGGEKLLIQRYYKTISQNLITKFLI